MAHHASCDQTPVEPSKRPPTATTFERMNNYAVQPAMGSPGVYPFAPMSDGPFYTPHAVPDRYSAHEIAGAAAWRKIQSAITKDPELGLALAVFMAGETDRAKLDESMREHVEKLRADHIAEAEADAKRHKALEDLAELETGELIDRVRAALVRLDEVAAATAQPE